MSIRSRVKPWLLDLAMRQMDPLRADTIEEAQGDVLEIGFGTALNLRYYGSDVKTLVGLDPMDVANVGKVQRRIQSAAVHDPGLKHRWRRDDFSVHGFLRRIGIEIGRMGLPHRITPLTNHRLIHQIATRHRRGCRQWLSPPP